MIIGILELLRVICGYAAFFDPLLVQFRSSRQKLPWNRDVALDHWVAPVGFLNTSSSSLPAVMRDISLVQDGEM